jgi:uncharacterized protein (TIGR02246 family)
MKRLIFVTALACLVAPGVIRAQADSAATTALVERQIEPLLNELTLAANAHDTDRFLASYLHGPALVFVFNGTVTKGWNNLEKLQLKWWNNGKSDVVYAQRAPSEFTVLGPDAAVVTSEMVSRRMLPDGKESTGEFAVTMVWQKRPEGWRIVQAHESTVH